MKGQILDYSVNENKGTITVEDGRRFYFMGTEWKGTGVPMRGMRVDFEADGNQASAVYQALGGATPGSKNKVAAGVLAILLGGLGIHKFYLGVTGPGLVFLLVNTVGLLVTWVLAFMPNVVLWVIGLVEGILYLTKTDEEFEQTYVVEKKQWF
jgi:TM2 domain-containing membrane protein YozV